MKTKTINISSGTGRAAAAGLCAAGVLLLLLFAKWAFGHAVAMNAVEPEVTAFGVDLAASDPNTHFRFAHQLERTLLPEDQRRALAEFESAAALSPHNYTIWLDLARAREQSGDDAGAEAALRKALELAPNYSRVQWALGNLLLRLGRRDEAFVQIRKAAAGDETFAGPAASAAWQIFDGDVRQIHEAVGDSPRINASIAVMLATEKRYAEAMDFWRRAAAGSGPDELKDAAQPLFDKLLEGGAYRPAIDVARVGGLLPNGETAGSVTNGGFESALTPGPFSWTIADGTFPRIGPNGDQKRSGNYSLLISYGKGGNGFRPVSQKIGVEAGRGYELQFFYRSELSSAARLRCDVLTAAGDPIAGAVLNQSSDWGSVKLQFTVPDGVDGIQVRIGMDNCPAAGCAAVGNVWFDDFSLTGL